MLQIRTVIADALRIDEDLNSFLRYCNNQGKIVKEIKPSGIINREYDQGQPLVTVMVVYEEIN
ncbi:MULTISPECIES: hypothetical protein [Bacillus cereus group]|jgi:hypothetical protein|uniref:hypothetical protein n=1 Tax=Bacillus cereus group TaxID=86661 RepID=UPI001F2081CF|nr:hypothetical protein [Bacillus cereus]MDA1521394.1 hypothetical protein [Bacillus cereus]BCC09399.1 hypothetical protein BCM0060_p2065 [Bacillus cereus]BCC16619.1 hypothetical protein BCM0075_1389 [Bacillus cereus]BCC50500.1 hypothetical protein BCJMU02_p2094 [Bacillus cereus]BCD08816.1 hypothetical protein BC30052_p2098 [Bacillus cereus]